MSKNVLLGFMAVSLVGGTIIYFMSNDSKNKNSEDPSDNIDEAINQAKNEIGHVLDEEGTAKLKKEAEEEKRKEEETKRKREEADKIVGQQSNSNAWNDEEDFDSDEGDDEFGLDS